MVPQVYQRGFRRCFLLIGASARFVQAPGEFFHKFSTNFFARRGPTLCEDGSVPPRSLLPRLLRAAGGGYHAAGNAAHLPASARVIDVPVFKNHTQAYHVELTMTQAVLREFAARTSFRTEAADSSTTADATLHGDITALSVYPLTYDSTTNQSSSYVITVTARVRLDDRDGRPLYANDNYVFRQQYQSTQDLVSFIREDPAAIQRLSRDFAQNLVADITESF